MGTFGALREASLMVACFYLVYLIFWALGTLWNRLLPKRKCNPWMIPAVLAVMATLGGFDSYLRGVEDLMMVVAELPAAVTCIVSARRWPRHASSVAETGIVR